MEGMVVTSTGFQEKIDKKELQTKIERMGGLYSNNFHEGVTHLVAKVLLNFKCTGTFFRPKEYSPNIALN